MKLFVYQNNQNLICIEQIHMQELKISDVNSWEKGLKEVFFPAIKVKLLFFQ